MAIYFLDSSAIVKHYHAEVGTAEVDRVLSEANSRYFIALLAVVEVQTVTQSLTRALRDSSLLHRRLGCLARPLDPRPARRRQAEN